MKLLWCLKCRSLHVLKFMLRVCSCGWSSGQYENDGINVTVKGPCVVLSVDSRDMQEPMSPGKRFEMWVIDESLPDSHVKREGAE